MMDWALVIERNSEKLVAFITELFIMAGFGRGMTAFLPRHVCRRLLTLLRPAESAVRRLIIIAARGIVIKLRQARAFPKGIALKRDAERVPAFCLIDPLKRFAADDFEWAREGGRVEVLPRISVPGLIDPIFAAAKPVSGEDDLISPAAIRSRLLALQNALDHLDRNARRLARWRARQGMKKVSRLSPFRPGLAPWMHRHEPREIDGILGDCLYFAREAWEKPDTS